MKKLQQFQDLGSWKYWSSIIITAVVMLTTVRSRQTFHYTMDPRQIVHQYLALYVVCFSVTRRIVNRVCSHYFTYVSLYDLAFLHRIPIYQDYATIMPFLWLPALFASPSRHVCCVTSIMKQIRFTFPHLIPNYTHISPYKFHFLLVILLSTKAFVLCIT